MKNDSPSIGLNLFWFGFAPGDGSLDKPSNAKMFFEVKWTGEFGVVWALRSSSGERLFPGELCLRSSVKTSQHLRGCQIQSGLYRDRPRWECLRVRWRTWLESAVARIQADTGRKGKEEELRMVDPSRARAQKLFVGRQPTTSMVVAECPLLLRISSAKWKQKSWMLNGLPPIREFWVSCIFEWITDGDGWRWAVGQVGRVVDDGGAIFGKAGYLNNSGPNCGPTTWIFSFRLSAWVGVERRSQTMNFQEPSFNTFEIFGILLQPSLSWRMFFHVRKLFSNFISRLNFSNIFKILTFEARFKFCQSKESSSFKHRKKILQITKPLLEKALLLVQVYSNKTGKMYVNALFNYVFNLIINTNDDIMNDIIRCCTILGSVSL